MSGGLRIIAGDWRGRRLNTPAGQSTRPTSARARETLFSMLTSRLGGFTGLGVADLFAGSGALGLEALSRGAAQCTFVERDRQAISALEANVALLDAGERARIIQGMVGSAARPASPVGLALLDPPYAEPGLELLLVELAGRGWFAPTAWVSVETGRDQHIAPPGFAVDDIRDIGKARLTLLRAPA